MASLRPPTVAADVVAPAMQRRRRRVAPRLAMLLTAVAGSTAALTAWSPSTSFVSAASQNANGRGDSRIRRNADYEAILRRDPTVNVAMQTFIRNQMKTVFRQNPELGGDDEEQNRRKEKLIKLGLAHKVAEMDAARPWHIEHAREGDVFKGWFEHPALLRGARINVELEITKTIDGGAKGKWSAESDGKRVPVTESFTMQQDFAIEPDAGEKRQLDITSYLFQKFNMYWRAWKDKPVPKAEEMDHLSFVGCRTFFNQVAQVEYPDQEEFMKVCADPETGMTKKEFQDWVLEDEPTYLDDTVVGFYTGRRVKFTDGDIVLDGDFQDKAKGFIIGFANYKGEGEGIFALQLVGTKG